MRLTAEFGGKIGLVRAAGAGAGRIAALRHEAGDDAVEDDAVVKAFVGELADPRDVLRGEIGAQLDHDRSEEHTSELQSLMRISYAVFCLKKKKTTKHNTSQEYYMYR